MSHVHGQPLKESTVPRTKVASQASSSMPTLDGVLTRTDRRAQAQATRAAQARKTSGRRRLVDPATCERDYSPLEIEFMQAMQEYKKSSGRMFPTWSEVLEVLQALGYRKDETGP